MKGSGGDEKYSGEKEYVPTFLKGISECNRYMIVNLDIAPENVGPGSYMKTSTHFEGILQ
jgi:hypothetical protein